MAPANNQHLQRGKDAEQQAQRRLQKAGLRLLENNYRVAGGEIDLIMLDGSELVFVEVRYRASSSHGSAAESVTLSKQRRLIKAAEHYLINHPENWSGCRFDVVAFDGGLSKQQMSWLQNAFGLDG